jgi:hypothetical protein
VKTIHLDDMEPSRTDSTLWKPIRSTLGVGSFGINAYYAAASRNVLVPEHDETEDLAGRQRHEELYIVLSGAAEFTVDGQTFEGESGTLVFVKDPRSRRAAVATQPETTLIAVGGPVGEPYDVPPWEERFLRRRQPATS